MEVYWSSLTKNLPFWVLMVPPFNYPWLECKTTPSSFVSWTSSPPLFFPTLELLLDFHGQRKSPTRGVLLFKLTLVQWTPDMTSFHMEIFGWSTITPCTMGAMISYLPIKVSMILSASRGGSAICCQRHSLMLGSPLTGQVLLEHIVHIASRRWQWLLLEEMDVQWYVWFVLMFFWVRTILIIKANGRIHVSCMRHMQTPTFPCRCKGCSVHAEGMGDPLWDWPIVWYYWKLDPWPCHAKHGKTWNFSSIVHWFWSYCPFQFFDRTGVDPAPTRLRQSIIRAYHDLGALQLLGGWL